MKSEYKEFGIYRITNIISGKTYIGKTGKNFGERWNCHRAQINGGYHDNPYLQRAWNKYGENSFEFAVVEVVDNVLKLNELEIKYIKKYKDMGLSYNILEGGDGGFLLGSHLSEDAKKRIGEKNRRNMTGKRQAWKPEKRCPILTLVDMRHGLTQRGELMEKKCRNVRQGIIGAKNLKIDFQSYNKQNLTGQS